MNTDVQPGTMTTYRNKEELHQVLSEIIEKVTDATGDEKILRIEKGLARAIVQAWTPRASKAIESALKVLNKSSNPVTESQGKQILSRLEKGMNGIELDVEGRVRKDFTEIYKSSKRAFVNRFELEPKSKTLLFKTFQRIGPTKVQVTKKVVTSVQKAPKISISFSIVDEELMDKMAAFQLLSIGDHFPQNLKPEISKMIKEAVIGRGLPNDQAGKFLQEELTRKMGGFSEAVPQWVRERGQEMVNNYFTGLVTTHVTMSRTAGSVLAMEEAGIAKYVWASIIDRATTPICSSLNGRVFELKYARQMVGAIMEAETVDELKALAPFSTRPPSGLGDKDSPTSEQVLRENGMVIPPAHFRCRSEVHPA